MKVKKIAAIFMVATMTASPLTAFAAGSATGTGTIEGYVVEAAFSVVLPTTDSASLAFVLDPQALLSVSDATNYGSETEGSVIFTATKKTSSPVIFATNKSSYPVVLAVDVTMTNDTTNPVTFVADNTAVNEASDSALNVYIAAVPEVKYTTVSTYTTSAPSTKVALPVDPTTLKSSLAFSVAGTQDNFEITYADPVYSYTPISSPTWDSVGFTLTGSCNKDANWDAYNTALGSLSCDVAWTMTKPDANSTITPYAIETVPVADDAYGLVDLVTVTPTAPAIATVTYPLTAITAVAVPVTLGLGTKAATGITSVTYNDGTVQTVDPADYTFASDILTFKSAYVDTLIAAEVASRAYTVTFNDTAATAVVVTLTYTAPISPVDPAIATTTYAVTAATAVVVPVTLGAGSSVATGITSVTYDDGSTQTLDSSKYTLVGTDLTFTSAYIDELIAGSVTTRAYTVTFNNTDVTAVVVTLNYTNPNVAPTYFASASVPAKTGDAQISIPLNLGTGTAAVTITKASIYAAATATGTEYPYTSSDYSVTDGNLVLPASVTLTKYILDTPKTYTLQVTFSNGQVKAIQIAITAN